MTAPLLSTADALRELGIGRRELGWRFLNHEIEPAEIDTEGRCWWRHDEIAALAERLAKPVEGASRDHAFAARIDELARFRARFANMARAVRVPEPV